MVLLFLYGHGHPAGAAEAAELKICSPSHWAPGAHLDSAVGLVLAQQVSHGRQISCTAINLESHASPRTPLRVLFFRASGPGFFTCLIRSKSSPVENRLKGRREDMLLRAIRPIGCAVFGSTWLVTEKKPAKLITLRVL